MKQNYKMIQPSGQLSRWALVASLLIFHLVGYAQVVVTGVVKDAGGDGELPGVTILIKGESNGTITDVFGNYSLEVPSKESVLVYRYVGYIDKEITVGDQTNIDVDLVVDVIGLEEVVVVGYGVQRKKEVTGAVASIKADEILKTATNDLGSAIQGSIAGVSVQASSGSPGASANIQIRGTGSFSATSPLYVVDGIPYAGNPNLTPEEIEKIEVLKDGAAAAIYGTRASNGVILITTKRGKKGEVKVSYSMYAGVQNITSGIPLMNTYEQLYAEEVEQRQTLGTQSEKIGLNPGSLDRDVDYVGLVLNNNAPMQNHNITISGGSENSTTALVANYYTQDGVLKHSGYERMSVRLNQTYNKDKLEVFSSLAVRQVNSESEPGNIYQNAITQRPYIPFPEGEGVVVVPFENPQNIGNFGNSLVNRNNFGSTDLNAALSLKYEIIEGLSIQVRGGGNITSAKREVWQPSYIVIARDGQVENLSSRPDAILRETNNISDKWTLESFMNYTKRFGDHSITALAAYTRERFTFESTIAQKSDFLSNGTQVFNAGNIANSITGNKSATALSGKLARVMYSYKDKYILSASMRQDGSSRFGPANRYGYFPGVSAGWNISEESFYKNLGISSILESIKLRGSFAEVGNQSGSLGDYQYTAQIDQGTNYPFGSENDGVGLALGAAQRSFANEEVKWETNIARNIGLDLAMFRGKLEITADVYNNEKEDMLLRVELPPSTGSWVPNSGSNIQVQNVGNMENRGVELAISYRGESDRLKYRVGGTFTKNVNEVTKLNPGFGQFGLGGGNPVPNSANGTSTTFLTLNAPVAAFLLIPTNGILKTDEDLEAYQELVPSARLGDLRYVDTNEDGVINGADRVFKGAGTPDFEIGFSGSVEFAGFDLSTQIFYAYGSEVYNGSKTSAYQSGRHRDQYYQWQPSNPDSDIPAMRRNGGHPNVQAWSDYFLEDGTYLRVRSIILGYTIPKEIFKGKIDQFRIYINAQNPLTFTKYTGFDPEIGYTGDLFDRGVDSGNYPIARKFLAGLQFNF